jgi:hypothetical protein
VIYTGEKDKNQLVMKFQHNVLNEYKSNEFVFVQKVSEYSLKLERLNKGDLLLIASNKNYKAESDKLVSKSNFWMVGYWRLVPYLYLLAISD